MIKNIDKEMQNKAKESNRIAGENVRKRRASLNISQETVGEYLNVNRATVQRYETGDIEIKRTIAIQLAKILKTTPSYIMGWQDSAEMQKTNFNESQLDFAYLSLAKDFQNDGVDPEDVKAALKLIDTIKNK